jgi:hypothetical protein
MSHALERIEDHVRFGFDRRSAADQSIRLRDRESLAAFQNARTVID